MIVTYDEFLATMRSFAWVSCACEKGACGVWDEVRFSGQERPACSSTLRSREM
ncbi:hypothetical protein BJX68DRAFT_236968 [Aspergillus pseudodeflectus]|uniref:Uncharacterized protein n=1 Tax=Aspergillus pseudodeflectus TaxID=176178 RepID=A0ABR4KEI5_9EURO